MIADEKNNSDLFWAVRGGGGNFGVVTRFKYRLHALPDFIGGPLVLPATPEVFCGFVEAAKAAPDELTTILQAMPAPPMPSLPENMVGKNVILGMMALAGPALDAGKALAPFRALAEPIADLVGPMPLSGMYLPDEPGPKSAVSIRSLYMEEINRQQATELLGMLDECDAPMRMVQLRVLGGAAARISWEETAYTHRERQIMTSILAMGEPDELANYEAWCERCAKIADHGIAGAYVNFLTDDAKTGIENAYPVATLRRLRQVKRRYDPQNLFRINHNILPAEM